MKLDAYIPKTPPQELLKCLFTRKVCSKHLFTLLQHLYKEEQGSTETPSDHIVKIT